MPLIEQQHLKRGKKTFQIPYGRSDAWKVLEQIIDLVSWGVAGIHLYTMNRPDLAERIMKNIGPIRESVTRER